MPYSTYGMAVPVPDFGLDGLEGQERQDKIEEILSNCMAEGVTFFTTDNQKPDNECEYDELTEKAIDIFGREAWERGERPTILKSASCLDTGIADEYVRHTLNKLNKRNTSMINKILLKLGLASIKAPTKIVKNLESEKHD